MPMQIYIRHACDEIAVICDIFLNISTQMLSVVKHSVTVHLCINDVTSGRELLYQEILVFRDRRIEDNRSGIAPDRN